MAGGQSLRAARAGTTRTQRRDHANNHHTTYPGGSARSSGPAGTPGPAPLPGPGAEIRAHSRAARLSPSMIFATRAARRARDATFHSVMILPPPTSGSAAGRHRAVLPPGGAAVLPPSAGGMEMERGGDPMAGHIPRMEAPGPQRLGMLNRLGMQYPMTSHCQTGMSMAPTRPTDSMRAMIQQTQAELVKSTLTSQAESARSLDVLRSLTTQAETMVVQPDFRFLQADLAIRSTHEGSMRVDSGGLQGGDQLGESLRLQDSLRLHHDPRGALGFLQTSQGGN